MAVVDDLGQLAQQDVAYLTRFLEGQGEGSGAGSAVIFRGRLHQALDGSWIFNTSIGQNGVAGINLGVQEDSWSSSENPQEGLRIFISNPIISPFLLTIPEPTLAGTQILFQGLSEVITLQSVIPDDLAL